MKNITVTRDPEHILYRVSEQDVPVARVPSGGICNVETMDAASGQLRPGHVQPFDNLLVNPVTGPIFVEGASPGDVLKVHIAAIELAPTAYVWVRPGLGFRTNKIKKPHVYPVALDPVSNEARMINGPAFRLHPHVGTVTVAPKSGHIASKWPGTHGGNLDCRSLRPGASLWLPIYQYGALFALGDVHAAMGAGEVGGTGAEAEATVTVQLTSYQSAHQITGPVIQDPDGFELFACGASLEDAAERALERGLNLLQSVHHMSYERAYMVASMACDMRICQVALAQIGVTIRIPTGLVEKSVHEWPAPI